jgi:hypothetical protein
LAADLTGRFIWMIGFHGPAGQSRIAGDDLRSFFLRFLELFLSQLAGLVSHRHVVGLLYGTEIFVEPSHGLADPFVA